MSVSIFRATERETAYIAICGAFTPNLRRRRFLASSHHEKEAAKGIIDKGEDELLEQHPTRILGILPPTFANPDSLLGRWLTRVLFWNTQRAAERKYYHARCQLLQVDEHLDSALAFSGTGE